MRILAYKPFVINNLVIEADSKCFIMTILRELICEINNGPFVILQVFSGI
jgi:hypothetical protein